MARAEINRNVFREEAYELLAELETSLMELEEHPGDIDLISRVFRAMHTIKGSGAMFGFEEVAAFTHDVETAFDMVRNGKLKVSKDLIDLTLAARDQIRAMLDSEDAAEHAPEREAILDGLRLFISGEPRRIPDPAVVPDNGSGQYAEPDGDEITYRIRFRPQRDIFLRGIDPMNLISEVRTLGPCTVVAQTSELAFLDELEPELCYTHWDLILTTTQSRNAIRDIFIFVEDDAEIKIDEICSHVETGEDYSPKRLGEILVERGDLSKEDLDTVISRSKRIGEQLVEAGVVEPGKVAAALIEQEHVKDVRERRQAHDNTASIRVASEKLDRLVNLVGELVTVHAHLSQTAGQKNDPLLISIAEEVGRLTEELRDNTMSIRMLPIGTTFSKLRRLVRDLSRELGKEIDIVTEGGETELDKTVIERLNDPLVHIIRNSIDHGIESPSERSAAGKRPGGTITISARHAGANVVIRIQDDGKGLDREAIRRKAIERGLILADAELQDRELFGLILQPGFSTARQVTSVSGRGVGMDVVKQSIEALKGTIDISSAHGRGTTITLSLPLTLAIIDGLLVRIAGDFFVFPLSAVRECIELSRGDVAAAHGRQILNVRGRIVPYVMLRELFMKSGERPEREQVVIAELDGQHTGFAVDAVIGEHQTVIKSLGGVYRQLEGLSGATILGDGTVALILDLPRLLHAAEALESASAQL